MGPPFASSSSSFILRPPDQLRWRQRNKRAGYKTEATFTWREVEVAAMRILLAASQASFISKAIWPAHLLSARKQNGPLRAASGEWIRRNPFERSIDQLIIARASSSSSRCCSSRRERLWLGTSYHFSGDPSLRLVAGSFASFA